LEKELNQYEGVIDDNDVRSMEKFSEFPGTTEDKIDEYAFSDVLETTVNKCRGSKVSSSYITFKTLNIREQLLINSFTVSNSKIGLCKKSCTARYCELFKMEFL
jgi:hypothetical protein